MRRREFIVAVGGAAAWPLVVRGQSQQSVPVVGFLNSLSSDWPFLPAFRDGLKEMGYVEGQNVAIEYRWAEGHYDRLPELAADLVRRHVAVIAATGGDPSALAAKATTATVPIIFNVAEDPVRAGLVTSLNRPGGNMTGVSMLTTAMDAKRLELLHDAIPGPAVVAALANPNFSEAETESRLLNIAARALNRQIQILNVSNDRDIDIASRLSRSTARRGAIRRFRPIFVHPARKACRAGSAICNSGDLFRSRVCCGGRLDELWSEFC
jgi:putative tryptophan/tyrosine transport system substrate-binding protein